MAPRSAKTPATPDPESTAPASDRRRRSRAEPEIAADLSYNEARTALELTLAELQASDLDVELMTGLYRRAESYVRRCEQLLDQVEHDVALWDADHPETPPTPYPA